MADYCNRCGNHVTTLLTHDCSKREMTQCPQCARFREKLDREKMIETVLAGTKGVWTYDTLTDFLIKYLTE